MGINAHARPGDMGVVVSGNTALWRDSPDEHQYDCSTTSSSRMIRRLQAGEHAIILAKQEAGSAKKGHVFLILVGTNVGWLWNHDLMVWDG